MSKHETENVVDENDGEDDLLYGDLEIQGKSAELLHLRNELQKERALTTQLRDECEALKTQVNCLVQDRTQLEMNMVSMYNTAILELKRKDRDIATLNSEIRQLRKK